MAEKKEKRYVSDNAQLMTEWNWEKNNALGYDPKLLTLGMTRKVWWKCQEGHEWQATLNNRNNGRKCPFCSGRKVLVGYNDLHTVNPNLANEWNYEKNNGLTPVDVMPNSDKKVWWKCQKGHEWQAKIYHRNNGVGCPICNAERNTSFPEYAILYYLTKYGLKAIHSYKGQGYELDIYIPSLKVAIEYDGFFWHKNKRNKDLEKNQKCKGDGIKLYRIRENLPPLNDSSIDFLVRENGKNFSKILGEILSEITRCKITVDIERDSVAIDNLRIYTEKENSLLLACPQIALEWNYGRNGSLKPENFFANSGKKVWWKCKKGHEWRATIDSRRRGRGCPYCVGQYVVKGENDLQTVNPVLANEWNYEKNNGLTPADVMPNSSKKVWWKCEKGHEWQSTIINRNSGNGCPYCSSRKVLQGYNDLQTVNPMLANEWNYEKNNGLTPADVMPNSNKKVWWKCEKGHEWQSTIINRNSGNGCPYCSSRKVLQGYNDLQTVNPMLANEWNYEKNSGLTPADVTPNSDIKVWWRCEEGHEWLATIGNRNRGRGCPQCVKEKRKAKK